jgi:cyclophilin family peptidyl-prolyl cis-trans isomerase
MMLLQMNSSIFSGPLRMLERSVPIACVFVLLVTEVRAVELTLVRTNVTVPSGQTFQMPLNGFDPQGLPLKFSVVSIKPKKVTGTIAPSTNRSLLLNVSGMDATNAPFMGDMVLQLYEDLTPLTTARIIDLVNSNFYNGLTFHRVIQDFMAQGGDPLGNGTGGSGVTFDDEFVKTLTFTGFGQLAMANSGRDSNDSQFFITDQDLSFGDPLRPSTEWLNFKHTIFGQMTSGFDVLEKIMETPVDSNDKPLTNVVINSASIITNSQDAVLRLTAAPGFIGVVTVTLNAMNTNNQSATQTLQVKVVADTNNDPAFLGPIPSSLVVSQNTAATFIITPTDIDGDLVSLRLGYADTGDFPTNITAIIDGRTGRLWFSPDLTLTGTVNLIIGVTDGKPLYKPLYDTQHFSLTFLPRSAAPTMTIVPLKGTMQDVSKPLGDSVKLSGTFAFNDQSDHAFGSNDVLILTVGDPLTPFTVRITPDNRGWKVRNGTANAKARVISGLFSNVNVSAQFNSVKGTFKMTIGAFDFPASLTNQIQVGIALGNDYGTDVRAWVEKKTPGVFAPPAIP